jgi:hypothetical protein
MKLLTDLAFLHSRECDGERHRDLRGRVIRSDDVIFERNIDYAPTAGYG